MTGYHWHCLCGATGHVEKPWKTDANNEDAKHHATCKAALVTGTDADVLGRVVERMRAVVV